MGAGFWVVPWQRGPAHSSQEPHRSLTWGAPEPPGKNHPVGREQRLPSSLEGQQAESDGKFLSTAQCVPIKGPLTARRGQRGSKREGPQTWKSHLAPFTVDCLMVGVVVAQETLRLRWWLDRLVLGAGNAAAPHSGSREVISASSLSPPPTAPKSVPLFRAHVSLSLLGSPSISPTLLCISLSLFPHSYLFHLLPVSLSPLCLSSSPHSLFLVSTHSLSVSPFHFPLTVPSVAQVMLGKSRVPLNRHGWRT